ncbi:hypothetical protein BC938DRAFT_475421 [Jimgerdemannia flammicorona]|uniref:Fungal-type protein kinase domain-containing protein n=1 Tax=Jimgerdemannia flammicorona TaxID=994334 RepID=A0A433PV54_9FUNG|nr:hypothetical protein BC938DRAFT_475421 [Jimgerdemannia flammicorona]
MIRIRCLGPYFADSMTIDENEHDLKHLIEDLKLLRRTTEVDLSNEATRSLYVDRFIVAAVSSFDKDVIVRPQKQLRGRHGQGPVDLGLESRHTTNTLGVTEIKKDDIKKGIAQNALQLEAFLTVSRKRKRGEVMEDPVMLKHAYGIITDAEKWYFLHCINDDKITFRLSKPVSVDWFSDYSNDVKTVLEHILWLLKEMGKAETETGVHWDTDISG